MGVRTAHREPERSHYLLKVFIEPRTCGEAADKEDSLRNDQFRLVDLCGYVDAYRDWPLSRLTLFPDALHDGVKRGLVERLHLRAADTNQLYSVNARIRMSSPRQ